MKLMGKHDLADEVKRLNDELIFRPTTEEWIEYRNKYEDILYPIKLKYIKDNNPINSENIGTWTKEVIHLYSFDFLKKTYKFQLELIKKYGLKV